MEKQKTYSQKINPFLWFNDNAEEAINYYVSIFKNSKIVSLHHAPSGAHLPEGTLMSGTFQIEGQTFHALNGGPQFKFTPALSLFVNCDTQQEVDELWNKLSTGGAEERCGWLRDKFGVSWQIIPTQLGEFLQSKDAKKSGNAMRAMMQMKKIDISELEKAYNQ